MKNHQFILCIFFSVTFIAFRPLTSCAQIDMGALFLQAPVQKNCYNNNETVTVRIKNYSVSVHNFVTAPLTVNANVTGPNAITFAPVVINTGNLPAGDSLSVVISTSYNMSAGGNYTFNASTTVAGDANAANNAIPPTAISVTALVAGTIGANPSAYCGAGGTPTLTLVGSSGGNIQWQESANITGPWTNVGSNNLSYTPSSAITATRYYRAYRSCNGVGDTTAIATVSVSSVQLISNTPAARCGPGTLNLAASASAGTSVTWSNAPQGGTILATGNNFTTPAINSTTTYYASSWIAGATAEVGVKPADFAVCGFPTATTTLDQPLRFTTNKGVVLNSVWIIPSTSSVTLGLRPYLSTNNITTKTFNFTPAQVGTPQQVNLNWSVAVPGNYQITNVSGGLWHITTLGCGYPFIAPGGSLTITGSAISSTAIPGTAFYNGYYGINFTEGCQSVPVPVIATVNDNTAITQQPLSSISTCVGAPVQFTVTSVGGNPVYQWRKNNVNIPNSNNDTLVINSVSLSDAGNYDVVITGTCGPAVTSNISLLNVASGNTWLGKVSTDWNDVANWCAGLPTSGSNVTIFPGTPFQPVIFSTSADVRSLTVSTGATLSVSPNTTLNVYGDLINNGNFNATNATIVFKGTIYQVAGNLNVGNIVVNGSGVTLNSPTTVNQALTLTNGNLVLGNNNLTISGSVAGNPGSHIVTNGSGSVISKNITSNPVTVPVGPTDNAYNPVVIGNGGGRDYSVRVGNGISPSISNPGKAVNRTWQISPNTAPSAPVNVTLQYADADMNSSGVATNNMEIGVHNGASWNVVMPSITPTGSSAARTVSANISQFGPIAVSNIGGLSWITATTPVDRSVNSVQLFPNPVDYSSVLTIVVSRNTKSHWKVIDINGKVVMSFERSLLRGRNDFPVRFGDLPGGIYTLKGSTDRGGLEAMRFIRQ